MKNTLRKLLFIVLTILTIACNKKDRDVLYPENIQGNNRTYTIMMYGCGGGNLDKAMIKNIQEALLAGSSDRVKFTGQVKFSARFQDTEEFKGTQRFVIEPENGSWYVPREILDGNLELYKPQNLTEFINWSKIECPADDYILVLWNHGSGWIPEEDDPDTRAILHDDNVDHRGLTLDELVEGIKDSGTKMKMIYYDACLMGMIEILTGIRDCAEYALCASHSTPNDGGDYNSLIFHLNNSTDFESAITEFCRETVSHWNGLEMSFDLSLFNLSKMDHLLNEIKVLSGYMEELAEITSEALNKQDEEGTSIYDHDHKIVKTFTNAINSCYYYEWSYETNGSASCPFYDIMTLVEILTNGPTNSYSARLTDIAGRIKRAMTDVIVCKQLTSVINNRDFTMGATIVDSDIWTQEGYDISYSNLEFDQLTNWGKWLSINPVTPTGNPNPLTIIGRTEFNDDDEVDADMPLDKEIELMLELIGKH